jgi:tetratricopeptide (TPR) repeat protein
VRLVVGLRLARLSKSAQRILELAAVIGRSFMLKVLEACTAAEELADRVEEAEKAGLIFSNPENPQFEFSHELIRQAVMSALPAARRQQLHLAVAHALEKTFANTLEDHYTELIHHNIRGGEVQRALHYLELAAMERFALGAFEQALTLARSARGLLESLPEGLERTRQQMRWQRSFSLALAISRGHEGEEVLTAFLRLAELSRRAGYNVELMEALKHIGFHYKARGELRKAREAAEEHLALAQRAGHRFQEAAARLDLGEVLHYLGELSLARENIEKAEAYCESVPVASNKPEAGYTSLFKPWNLRARDYIRPLLDWYLGFPDQARKRSPELVVAAQEVDLTLFADALRHAGTLYALCREPQAIRQHMERLIELTKQYDLKRSYLIFANCLQAWALLLSGQVQDAIVILRDCHTPGLFSAGVQINLAAALVCAGQAKEALEVADRALASPDDFRVFDAEVHRVRGEALLVQTEPRWEEAERCFRTAIEIARRQGAKSWELRATTSLARLLARRGRRNEGRAMLTEIYGWFTEGFDTADLKDAKALLDELGR